MCGAAGSFTFTFTSTSSPLSPFRSVCLFCKMYDMQIEMTEELLMVIQIKYLSY